VMGRRTRSSETRRRARAAGEPGRQVPSGPNAERRPALPLAAAPRQIPVLMKERNAIRRKSVPYPVLPWRRPIEEHAHGLVMPGEVGDHLGIVPHQRVSYHRRNA
jgi:hypothetical protein